MDFSGRLEDFDLEVNPYDFLGLARGCKDLKEIKKAYHKKSMLLHPDKKKGNDIDFSTLNKCYIYLKTLCQELYGIDDTAYTDAENRMRQLQQVRLDAERKYEKKRRVQTGNVSGRSGERCANIDFSQPLPGDNCIIGADNFDTDRVLNNMMKYRPTTTTYKNLDLPNVSNPFGNKKFNLNQFNNHFNQKVHNGRDEDLFTGFDSPVDGFSGNFEELGGAANVVSDGRYMFVQGHIPSTGRNGEDISVGKNAAIYSYGVIEQFSEYDRNLEKERFERINLDGKVSDADLKSFSAMYDQSGNSDKKKLSRAQFNDSMGQMENSHWEHIERQKRHNKDIVDAQIAQLSDGTRANLQNSLRITGTGLTAVPDGLSAKQAARFSFPK